MDFTLFFSFNMAMVVLSAEIEMVSTHFHPLYERTSACPSGVVIGHHPTEASTAL